MKTIVSSTMLLFVLIFTAQAQFLPVNLSGHVTDVATGAPVPNHAVNAEIMSGGMVQYYFYYTNANGYYGDSIPTFGQGTLNVSTIDCNGDEQSYSGTFSPANNNFVFDFSICTDSISLGCQALYTYQVFENGVVAFYDQSTGNPMTGSPDHWLWEFGDSTTSNEQSPVHAYNAFGPFTVCLTIWDDEGLCQDTWCDMVYLEGSGGDCENWFTFETNNNVDYAFMGQSSPVPADFYFWDFGDGSTAFGENVTHTFNTGGIAYYIVTLTTLTMDPSTNDSCTAVSSQEVWVNGNGGCTNWFTYETLNNTQFSFIGQSAPEANYYFWDFGDGEFGTGQFVSHSYGPNSGPSVFVALTTFAYDPATGDSCVANSNQEIWINGSGNDCENWFWYVPLSAWEYTFHGESSPYPADEYMWQFDNGSVLFGQEVTYTFEPSPIMEHLVCLTTFLYTPAGDSCFYTSCQSIITGGQTGVELTGAIYTNDSLTADFALVGLFGMQPDGSFTYDFIVSEQGMFFFENVQPGDYYIFASLTPQSQFFYDYFPTYYGDAITWSGATLITLGEPQNPYDIHLVPAEGTNAGPGIINGSVTLGEGKGDPGSNITVMLMDENESAIAFTESDEEGLFSFVNLAYGTYKLKVEIPGKPSATASVILQENNPEGEVTFIVKNTEVVLTAGEISTFANFVGEVFPNPVTDMGSLEISLIRPSNLTLRVLNQLGQEVQSSKLSLSEGNRLINFETSHLRKGLYTLQITNNEGGMLVKKFIK